MNRKRIAAIGFVSALFPSVSFGQGSVMDDFEIFRSDFVQTGGMDIDGNNGEFSLSRFNSQLILSRPIELFSGIRMVPTASYTYSRLDLDDTGLFPIHDEELHSISLSSMYFKSFENTKWMAVGWNRVEMASDFQEISNDDFTFDVALGAAYQFNDDLNLGFGFVILNLNNDEMIFPGINFMWTPCEHARISLFGPNLRAVYRVSDKWHLSLNGEPGGGIWNIRDDTGASRSIELDSYLLGINTHHHLSGNLWFVAGVGYTFGSELEIRENDGGAPSFSREMDGAAFARIGLSLTSW